MNNVAQILIQSFVERTSIGPAKSETPLPRVHRGRFKSHARKALFQRTLNRNLRLHPRG